MISEMPVNIFLSEAMIQYPIFVEMNLNLSILDGYPASYSANTALHRLIIS